MRLMTASLAVLACTVLGAAYRNRSANGGVYASDLHVWPAPQPEDRILIFAPHCDDETLGLSGYVQQAVRAGATVHVVFMTNGDGFQYSAERQLHRFRVSPSGFVEFGEDRQREALAALAVSGVPARDVTFLGYPDRGLANLWLQNWTPKEPFESRFTGHWRSPYPNSLTPGAVYCGESVLADVSRVIRDFRPTYVFCTHPNENHPDHWATYAFVTAALYDQEQRAAARGSHLNPFADPPPVQGLYLIHRGDWPVPQGYRPDDDLPPPSGLLHMDTHWRQFPLQVREEATKRQAIRAYASQTRVMNRFLVSFVRRNELVGTLDPGPLTAVDDGAIRVDGDLSDWTGLPVSVQDPTEDSLPSDFGASGDIVSITAAEDDRRLYVRIETRKPISPRVTYEIYWHALPDDPTGTRGISLRLGRPLPANVSAVPHGRFWEVALPRPEGRAVFLGVDCRYRGFVLDKSGWRILERE